MGGTAISTKPKIIVLMVGLAAAWVLLTVSVHADVFGIARYLGWSVAGGLASTILGYLNSWWGFAAAVATAAAFGLSWTVVLIKAMLQKVGMKFALQYATAL